MMMHERPVSFYLLSLTPHLHRTTTISFALQSSDLLTNLNAFNEYKKLRGAEARAFLHVNFLSYQTLNNIDSVRTRAGPDKAKGCKGRCTPRSSTALSV